MPYKFLIYISYSYALPIGNPLEIEIIKRGWIVKWFSDLEEGAQALNQKDNVLKTIKDVTHYEPHVILAATNTVPDFINALKVQIFHGFLTYKRPVNNTEAHFKIRGFFDLYCTQGPSTTSTFQALSKKLKHFEVIETGWSKVDPLFPIQRRQKNDIPTVMIASTFTKRLSLAYNNSVLEKIKYLSNSGIFKFIVVLHPKIPQNIRQLWKALENNNLIFEDTTDLIPLFVKTDVMFADTTSAIQEYLLQKKPVITFKHNVDRPYLIDIDDVEHIEQALLEALKYPPELLQKIEEFITNLHPYQDGKSSSRVIDACVKMLNQDNSFLKAKPWNLVRKYKIRKRLGSFTLKTYNKPYTLNINQNK